MKIIAGILVIVFLGLFVSPCTDSIDDCMLNSAIHTSHMDSNHDQESNDHCSPFCTCSCCGIALNTFHFSILTIYSPIVPIPVSKKVVFRNVTFNTYYQGSIWQPPQLFV